jgi:hypothetical protein
MCDHPQTPAVGRVISQPTDQQLPAHRRRTIFDTHGVNRDVKTCRGRVRYEAIEMGLPFASERAPERAVLVRRGSTSCSESNR